MNQLTRREFIDRLGKLGLMLTGGLIVPYIPKVIYSIPAPISISEDWIWVPYKDLPGDFPKQFPWIQKFSTYNGIYLPRRFNIGALKFSDYVPLKTRIRVL